VFNNGWRTFSSWVSGHVAKTCGIVFVRGVGEKLIHMIVIFQVSKITHVNSEIAWNGFCFWLCWLRVNDFFVRERQEHIEAVRGWWLEQLVPNYFACAMCSMIFVFHPKRQRIWVCFLQNGMDNKVQTNLGFLLENGTKNCQCTSTCRLWWFKHETFFYFHFSFTINQQKLRSTSF